jgi:hypothetical protein
MSFSSALNSANCFWRSAVALSSDSVLRDLLLEVLDLRVQAGRVGGQLLDLSGQLRDALLRISDGLRLLCVVRLAPARHLVVHLLIGLDVSLQLLLHVLQQSDDLRHRAVLRLINAEAQSGHGSNNDAEKLHYEQPGE